MKNYYEILEVDKNASPEVIDKAYKTLVKKYHPDLQEPHEKEQAESKIKEINEAYDVLSDKTKRNEYNKTLQNNSISIEKYNLIVKENQRLKNELDNIKNIYYQNINNYSQNNNNYSNVNNYSQSNNDYSNEDNYSQNNTYSNTNDNYKNIKYNNPNYENNTNRINYNNSINDFLKKHHYNKNNHNGNDKLIPFIIFFAIIIIFFIPEILNFFSYVPRSFIIIMIVIIIITKL